MNEQLCRLLTFNEFHVLLTCPATHLRAGPVVVLELSRLQLGWRDFELPCRGWWVNGGRHDLVLVRLILLARTMLISAS